MSRKKSNRKGYLKRKLVNAGYDVQGLDLFQLEELDKEYKRETVMQRRMDRIEKKQQPIGTIEGEREYQADRDFYSAISKEPKNVHNQKIPYGVSLLIKGFNVGELVDLDGNPIPEKKKNKASVWGPILG